MERIDYRKVYDEAYQPAAPGPGLVLVPPMNFLMLDGRGAPGPGNTFDECAHTLRRLSQLLATFILKGPMALGLTVMPVERLERADAPAGAFEADADESDCTLMIMQPPVVSADLVHEAKAELHRREGLPLVPEVRFERFEEGTAVQLVHRGPLDDRAERLAELREFATAHGMSPRGRSHDIFLSDVGREPPEHWRTILRQPVAG